MLIECSLIATGTLGIIAENGFIKLLLLSLFMEFDYGGILGVRMSLNSSKL